MRHHYVDGWSIVLVWHEIRDHDFVLDMQADREGFFHFKEDADKRCEEIAALIKANDPDYAKYDYCEVVEDSQYDP